MDNAAKEKLIAAWIDPNERVTVDFVDEKNLNAEVTGCSKDVVDLALETAFPHLRQELTFPLGRVEVGEDSGRYTRDPDRPLRYGRLRLSIDQKRPHMM